MTESPDAGDVLTIQQVADITGLAVKTLRNLRSLGEGPHMWLLRGRVRCYRADLNAWISEQSGATVTPLRRRA